MAQDDVDGGGWLSTVWLGVDHGRGRRPLIFETMLFQAGHPCDEQPWRYATEEAARAGHAELLKALTEE